MVAHGGVGEPEQIDGWVKVNPARGPEHYTVDRVERRVLDALTAIKDRRVVAARTAGALIYEGAPPDMVEELIRRGWAQIGALGHMRQEVHLTEQGLVVEALNTEAARADDEDGRLRRQWAPHP